MEANSKVKETVQAHLSLQLPYFPYGGRLGQTLPFHVINDASGHFLSNPGLPSSTPAATK